MRRPTDWRSRCTKCRRNPALDNETQTCRECEDKALDAILVAAMRGLPNLEMEDRQRRKVREEADDD